MKVYTVYVICFGYDYESGNNIGAWQSMQLAKEACQKHHEERAARCAFHMDLLLTWSNNSWQPGYSRTHAHNAWYEITAMEVQS